MLGILAISTSDDEKPRTMENMKSQLEDYVKSLQAELFGTQSLPETTIENHFKLPITYVEPNELHVLSANVSADLELATSENKPMYEHLFQPTHEFAKKMVPEWNKQYTSNTKYLEDSQAIVKQMGYYKKQMGNQTHAMDCDKITEIWKDIKQNPRFLDKYGFVEWNSLRYLNQSPYFLECLSVANVMSPLVSLSIPFFIFFFPFLILKIQGVDITFETYLDVLKNIARHHFIGKTLSSLEDLSMDKLLYLMFSFGLYLLQIYQNITSCQRFYNNTKYINDALLEMKSYVNYSIASMETYLHITSNCGSHVQFCSDTYTQCQRLKTLAGELEQINSFSHSMGKFTEVGYMLKCLYELHTNPDYESALMFSMGFEGYIDNLKGVYENIDAGLINYAMFSAMDSSLNTIFKKQYYPPLRDENPVKNDCGFNKNIILSAPNKAGKTTVLKTTTINIIFSQQIGCGFYKSCNLVPYTHIHSYLNIPDTSGRDSLFQAESRRCKEILDIIHKDGENIDNKMRHFCIFDELFSGTNPKEATKAGSAFLHYLTKFPNVDFMLTTHYVSICKKFRESKTIENFKMGVNVLDNGAFEYTYKMKRGISVIRGAIRVLKDLNYPKEILDMIE